MASGGGPRASYFLQYWTSEREYLRDFQLKVADRKVFTLVCRPGRRGRLDSP